jgi:hypothetical protein
VLTVQAAQVLESRKDNGRISGTGGGGNVSRLCKKPPFKGVKLMEVYQALTLMFMFGMFILALLTYLKRK